MSLGPKNYTYSATLGPSDAETLCTLNAAAGLTMTLPPATGSGMNFKLYIGTTVTSNAVIVQVASAADTMAGLVISAADTADTVNGWETAADTDTITFDGSTTGGIKGDWCELTDCAANLWTIKGQTSSTGTEATPFSAAVA